MHVITPRHLPVIDRLIPGAGACLRVHRAISRIAKTNGLDIIEFPNWEGFGCLFALRRKVPLVVRLSTSSMETQTIDKIPDSRPARWDVRRERWLARHADALVTHSAAHRQRMAEELGMPADRIALAPHGIRVFPEFCRPPRSPGDLRVVFLGRMEKRKGALDLLNAIPEVLEHVSDAQFIFIGSDRAHCPGGMTHTEYIRRTFSAAIRPTAFGCWVGYRTMKSTAGCKGPTCSWHIHSTNRFGLIFLEAMR